MAKARIVHHYTDGGITELSMTVDDTFPDAPDEARAQVAKLWRMACTDGPVEVDSDVDGWAD